MNRNGNHVRPVRYRLECSLAELEVLAGPRADDLDLDLDLDRPLDLAGEAKRTLVQRGADALALFAESYLKHGFEALNGGELQQIVVHVSRLHAHAVSRRPSRPLLG
jgi:hypothetical protein